MWTELSREEAIELICRLIELDVSKEEIAYEDMKKLMEEDV